MAERLPRIARLSRRSRAPRKADGCDPTVTAWQIRGDQLPRSSSRERRGERKRQVAPTSWSARRCRGWHSPQGRTHSGPPRLRLNPNISVSPRAAPAPARLEQFEWAYSMLVVLTAVEPSKPVLRLDPSRQGRAKALPASETARSSECGGRGELECTNLSVGPPEPSFPFLIPLPQTTQH